IGRSNRLTGTVESHDGDRATIRLASGDLIEARSKDRVAAGARVVCVVRPEHMAIGTAAAGRNTIIATLQRRSFLGETVDLVLTDRAGGEFVVRAAESTPTAGQDVVAHFAPADTLCFAAPER